MGAGARISEGPVSACFCLLCRAYKRKLHFCSALDKYVNIDERQMLLMEGGTAAEVEGLDSNTGKCTVFENRRIMKYYLFNRVGLEKEYKKKKPHYNKETEECVRSILDPETNKYVDNSMFVIMKDWLKKLEFWRISKANVSESKG